MSIQCSPYENSIIDSEERHENEACDYKIPVGCHLLHCVTNCPHKKECIVIKEMKKSANKCCEKFFKHFEKHFIEAHKPITPLCGMKLHNPSAHMHCPYQANRDLYRSFNQPYPQCPYQQL